MLQLTLDSNQALYQIRAFEPGRITINDQVYTTSLIISPTQLIVPWSIIISDLTMENCQPLLQFDPKIILFGSGDELIFPPQPLLAALAQQGIGVEVMNSYAACRTYQVLTAEGREVVAGIVI